MTEWRDERMNKRYRKVICLTALLTLLLSALTGCGGTDAASEPEKPKHTPVQNTAQKPPLPDKLKLNDDGVPILRVYQVDEEETREMDLESYLRGVLAGEMKNDWPLEALKAQAILARTFVLKFCTEKESKYQGADISTDIEEAQAYDATGINDRIEQAVRETRGLVLSYRGELPYAWFHAHSGGTTEKAVEGLHYEGKEPGYTKVTAGRESDQAPVEAKAWQATFSRQEVMAAAKKAGYSGDEPLNSIRIGKTGDSGRAVTVKINGQEISAPELRLALDARKMRSTWITEIRLDGEQVSLSGKGYGHGVGTPQWGAYGMAEEGKTAEEIVTYYFNDVTVEKLW